MKPMNPWSAPWTSPHCLASVQGKKTSIILVDILYVFCCCKIRALHLI